MTKPSVKIKIEAEDEASAKLAEANAKIDATATKIKATTDQTKKSTEVAGAFASAFGGSELGSFASQIAGLTDKVGAFSEVAKNGGTSSFAFKAGLAAVVGVAAFEVGKAIGNAVFQVDKWNKKLEQARERIKELADSTASLQSRQFDTEIADIEIIKNPANKDKAYQSLLQNLNRDLEAVEAQTRASRKAAEEWEKAWQITGERKAEAQIAKDLYEEDKKRLKVLQDRRQQVMEVNSEEAKAKQFKLDQIAAEEQRMAAADAAYQSGEDQVQQLLKQLELEQAIGAEKFDVMAVQASSNKSQQDSISYLMREIEHTKTLRAATEEVEKARIAAVEGEAAARARDLEKSGLSKDETKSIMDANAAVIIAQENEALKQQTIAFEQSEAALKEYMLVRQGLSKDDANKIVANEMTLALKQEQEALRLNRLEIMKGTEARRAAELEKRGFDADTAKSLAKQEKDLERFQALREDAKNVQSVGAAESRFLRSGVTNDPQKEIAENTKRTQEHLAKLIAIQEAAGNTENADRLRKKSIELEPIA